MKIKTKKEIVLAVSVILLLFSVFISCKKESILPDETSDADKIENSDPDINQKPDNSESTNIDSNSHAQKDTLITIDENIPPISSSAYNIVKALPKGFVKDASIDYTSYIQHAINQYDELIFPDFPVLINDNGLKIPSNRKIHFLNGSELRLKPTEKGTYNILDIRSVSNITLISPVIKGDKNVHLGTKGEWGMGIGIRGSSNIEIIDADISDCWGDGIYIDNYRGVVPKNIKIINSSIKYNRRDGISIISIDGLLIEDSYFGYTSGTLPMAGINFEPDNSSSEFKNINLKNVITENNGACGIQLSISPLYGSGKGKLVSFNFENIKDYGSPIGFKASCYTSAQKDGETISGNILLNSPFWKKNSERALKTNLGDSNLKIIIQKPKVTLLSGNSITEADARNYLLKKGNINPTANYTITW